MRYLKLILFAFLALTVIGCSDEIDQGVEEELYRPILVIGGRLVADKSNLDASQLEIPADYLLGGGEEKENGETGGFKLGILISDLSPSKPYFHSKGLELKEKYPDEKELSRSLPILKNMSESAREDFVKIRNEYKDNVIEVDVSSPRDLFGLEEAYEGSFSLEKRIELKKLGEYFGPSNVGSKISHLNHLRDGVTTSARVGKFGEGLWSYKDGLGRDYIRDKANREFELYEYAKYASKDSPIPSIFYYTPVVSVEPHQLYIACDWNGNIDFLSNTKCSGSTYYDNTIGYTFKFYRHDLVNAAEINQKIRTLIESFIVRRSSFSELRSQNLSGKN